MRRTGSGPLKLLLAGAVSVVGIAAGTAQTPPETIRLNVDPPSPGIRSVLMDKKYRPIISRDAEGVIIDTLDSDGAPPACDVKLEITLENSRVLHRDADLCAGGTLVVDVATDGKPGQARVIGGPTGTSPAPETPPAEATSPEPDGRQVADKPQETPPAATVTAPLSDGSEDGALPPLERAETPIDAPDTDDADPEAVAPDLPSLITDTLSRQSGGETITIEPSEARVWRAETGTGPGAPSTLVHGVAETDDADFRAACDTQSGVATVTLLQTQPAVQEGLTHPVGLSAGAFTQTYSSVGSSLNNQYGQSFPELALPMTDPLWQALIREASLTVSIEGMAPYSVSLKGSAGPVRLFVAACSEAQRIVGEDGLAPGASQAGIGDVACTDVGRIRSIEGVRPGQIVFRNVGSAAISVHWIDYNGGERPYARLEPGQILEQQTFVSHAWIVRGIGGQCQGIFISRTPYREVTIGTSGAGPALGQPVLPPADFAGPVPPGLVGAGPAGLPSGPGPGNIADYLCTAGIDLNVVFAPDGQTATVAEMGYGVVTLQRQADASGFHYAGQGHVLKGQIQNATWTRPGLRDVFCARR